eukprot:m51a1_g7825 hypothetical protein (159) ;mRNA; r:145222-145698
MSAPLCPCGSVCILHQCKKKTPNKGHWFYSCPVMNCPHQKKVFQWADTMPSTSPAAAAAPGPVPSFTPSFAPMFTPLLLPRKRPMRPAAANTNMDEPETEEAPAPDAASELADVRSRLHDIKTMLDILTKSVVFAATLIGRSDVILCHLDQLETKQEA